METRAGDFVPLSWPWLVVASTLVCGLSLLYLWWQHPRYGRNTGPKVFPVVGCLPQMLMNGNRLYDWTTEELKKTPTMTMRVSVPGLEYVETGNPANLEHILKTNFHEYPKGDFFRSFFTDLLGLGIFNADGSLWKVQRRVGSQEFNTGTLQDSAIRSVQRELTERFLPLLDRSCDANATVDLQDLLLRFTFDTICQLAFGTDPGCLKTDTSSAPVPFESFARAFDDAVLQSTLRVWSVFPPWQVTRFFNIGSERKLRHSLATIDSFAFDLIRKRRKELLATDTHTQPKPDLLSRFIKIADDVVETPEIKQRIAQDPRSTHQNPSDLFLRDIVISFILAGRDTSACGLTWFFWILSRNPSVEANLCNEINSTIAARKGESPEPSGLVFSFEELKHMHYLHAALTESMRLYPPVPDDSKEAAVDNVFPDGTVIPKGIRVSFHMYAMGRSERIWGPDCLAFRPERFLRDGVFVPPSPFDYPVFQAGPRICLGKDIGMVQMKLVAATLLSRYVFAVREGHRANHDWSLTMKILEGLPVTVKRRREQ
jgi:cytochrome P450